MLHESHHVEVIDGTNEKVPEQAGVVGEIVESTVRTNTSPRAPVKQKPSMLRSPAPASRNFQDKHLVQFRLAHPPSLHHPRDRLHKDTATQTLQLAINFQAKTRHRHKPLPRVRRDRLPTTTAIRDSRFILNLECDQNQSLTDKIPILIS